MSNTIKKVFELQAIEDSNLAERVSDTFTDVKFEDLDLANSSASE